MGRIRRTLQFLITLAGAVATLFAISLFVEIPSLSLFVRQELLERENLAMAIGIVLGLILLLLLIRFFQAIFARPRRSDLILNKNGGQISLSSEALVGLARSTIEKLDGVRAGRVEARFYQQPEETEIDAEVVVDEMTDLVRLGEEVQSALHQAVSTMLGVDVKQIKVQLLPAGKEDGRSSGPSSARSSTWPSGSNGRGPRVI